MAIKIPSGWGIEVKIDLTNECYRRGGGQPWESLQNILFRIKGVQQVCLNHCCWVTVKSCGDTFEDLKTKTEKVERLCKWAILELGSNREFEKAWTDKEVAKHREIDLPVFEDEVVAFPWTGRD